MGGNFVKWWEEGSGFIKVLSHWYIPSLDGLLELSATMEAGVFLQEVSHSSCVPERWTLSQVVSMASRIS